MKKNKNNISIFKRIGLIAVAVAIAIGSFFVNVPKNGHSHSLVASANDVTTDYTFNGSNIYVPLWRSNYDNTTYYIDTGVVAFKINSNSSISLVLELVNSNVFYNRDTANSGSYNYSFYRLGTGALNGTILTGCIYTNFGDYQGYSIGAYSQSSTDLASTYQMFIICNSSVFNSNIYKVTFNNENLTLDNRYSTFNTITYYDVNDNYVKILFRQLEIGYNNQGSFQNRTYFFNTDLSENQIYNQGYQQGLADNQSTIYDNGYNAGKTVGESIGFDKGLLEANDYSFSSLFGAVIDAPIKAFSGLFNFEILGINLLDFFLGLLTFGVVIFVVKLLLGGK